MSPQAPPPLRRPLPGRGGPALLLGCWALVGCAAEHVIGTRGLLTGPSYPGAASSVTAAALGDFDGDGLADLVLLSQPPLLPSQLCLLTGDGSGALTPHPCMELPTSWAIRRVAALRWQQPGATGLIAVGEELVLLGGHGDGTFTTIANVALASGANAVVASDLSADSAAAVLVAESRAASVSVWPLTGAGSFGSLTRYELKEAAQALLYQDLDGDGRPELATVSPSTVTVVGSGRGPAQVAQCPPSIGQPGGQPYGAVRAIGAVERGSPGAADLLLATSDGGGGLLELRGGAGSSYDCGSGGLVIAQSQPAALLGRDFDGDGVADLLSLGSNEPGFAHPGELLLLRGQPLRSAADPLRYPLPAAAVVGAIGDLNGDGHPDVVALLSDGSIAVLINSFADL